MPNITEFIRIANEQQTGLGVKESAKKYRQENNDSFNNLSTEISFGIGRATNIPWIAFLKNTQKVQRGIYPVFLYYKDDNLLILSYGVSETNEPLNNWPDSESFVSISEYYFSNFGTSPKKYGNSYVYKAYSADSVKEKILQKDLLDLTIMYNKLFEIPATKKNSISYDFDNDPDKPFISRKDFSNIVALLKKKKNIILQGAPGVGKTFIARKVAYQIIGKQDDSIIEMLQFHQSYSYEDFIQGLRPTTNGFKVIAGVFFRFCQNAIANPDKSFFLIIDEINRGNLSKIFGELLMLLEADKRDKKYAIKLTYSEIEDDKFYVPENLYLIGTMNTADHSLSIVDYALRRRFAFITLHPDYNDKFQEFLLSTGLSKKRVSLICDSIIKLNKKIANDPDLGEGFQIGQSYFCSFVKGEDENIWWQNLIDFELRPMLQEIWFDDNSKVIEMVKILTD